MLEKCKHSNNYCVKCGIVVIVVTYSHSHSIYSFILSHSILCDCEKEATVLRNNRHWHWHRHRYEEKQSKSSIHKNLLNKTTPQTWAISLNMLTHTHSHTQRGTKIYYVYGGVLDTPECIYTNTHTHTRVLFTYIAMDK